MKAQDIAGLEIIDVPLSDLKEDQDNARAHPEENLSAIRASLERFGQVEPIVIRPDGTVISGNGRLQVLRELGVAQAHAVIFEGTDEEAKALGLVLNRTAELALWKPEALGRALLSLEGQFTAQSMGFGS